MNFGNGKIISVPGNQDLVASRDRRILTVLKEMSGYYEIRFYDSFKIRKGIIRPFKDTLEIKSVYQSITPKESKGKNKTYRLLFDRLKTGRSQDGNAKLTGLQNNNLTLIWGIEDVDPSLQAIDLETGEIVKEIPLEQNSYGAPMTYEINGKQYIVMPYGGANKPSGYVAYSLAAD